MDISREKILYHPGRDGALLPPITVDHVPHESELVMEETFGPIVPIVRVPDNDEQVMAISNSTQFGLSSGVCTNDFRRMQAFIEGLDVGGVLHRSRFGLFACCRVWKPENTIDSG